MKTKLLIVGAGMAGLSMGYFLNKQGFTDFIIVEADKQYGGYLKKFIFEGQEFDIGLKNIKYRNEDTTNLIEELKIPFKVVEHDGRYFDMLEGFNPRFIPTPIDKFFNAKPLKEVHNYKDYLMRYDNETLNNMIVGYAEKSTKYPLEFLSSINVEKARQHQELSLNIVSIDTKDLVERIAEPIKGKILLQHPLQSIIQYPSGKLTAVFPNTNIEFEHMVFTIPLPIFLRACRFNPNLFTSENMVDYVGLFLIFIIADKDVFDTKFRALHYYQPNILFSRINVNTPSSCSIEFTFSKEKMRAMLRDDIKSQVVNDCLNQFKSIFNCDVKAYQPMIFPYGNTIQGENYYIIQNLLQELQGYNIYAFGRFAEWNNIEIHSTITRAKSFSLELINKIKGNG
jgi:protoporphyrinogen oxidase